MKSAAQKEEVTGITLVFTYIDKGKNILAKKVGFLICTVLLTWKYVDIQRQEERGFPTRTMKKAFLTSDLDRCNS